LLGVFKRAAKLEIQGIATADTVLKEGDIMVLYGHNDNIDQLLRNKN
jgi:Trk K+ transport system NAD-binding subunit